MEAIRPGREAGVPRGSAVVAVGFGTTVAMWGVGYVGRLPALMLPSPLMLLLLVGCLVGGGIFLGRRAAGAGWRDGALAGMISGLLNLLVLMSVFGGASPNEVAPSALWWVPGSILSSGGLGAAGALAGSRWLASARPLQDWLGALVRVAIVATLLLLAVGGLVTSAEAGLAVDDWPTSFGYNMFLYPLSKMTGGVYYEHAHRLFGALVGLTTLVVAVSLQLAEPRRWVRVLGWSLFAMVLVQGAMGGIRVTERHLGLAMAHGILAQAFFGALVALGVFCSDTWRRSRAPRRRVSAGTDKLLAAVLVSMMLGQLVLGAAQRHFHGLLIFHIVFGIAIVAPLCINVGIRAWGLNEGLPLLQRLGLLLLAGICLQVMLGLGAYAVTGLVERGALSRTFDLTLSTAHQWFGAMLLATAVTLLCLNSRLLSRQISGK